MPSLYIDESGDSDLLSPRYRFFLMTGIVMSDDEVVFAERLLKKWKKKHSLSLDLGFHAYDLFESNENNALQLRTHRIFNTAVKQLIDIVGMIEYEAYCAVIDLKLVRESMNLQEPPIKVNFSTKSEYKKAKKDYDESFAKSHGDKKRNLPLEFALDYLLKEYKSHLNTEKSTNGNSINFESLSANDAKIIQIFHQLQSSGNLTTQYGKDIHGIKFHTKSSWTSAIEIADLISYSVTQSYRSKHHLKSELLTVPKRSLLAVRTIKKSINPKTKFHLFKETKKPV